MRSLRKILVLGGLVAFLGSACYGATITGTVNGADGAPFQGAFVEAQNAKTKITVIVLSDSQGRYRIPDLPAGDYRVQIRAVGYRADPRYWRDSRRRPKRFVRFCAAEEPRCAGMKFPNTRRRSSGLRQKGRN